MSAHASKQSGHFKLNSTYNRVFSIYHWRQMKADISVYISKCLQCNVSGDKPNLRNQVYSNLECSVLGQCIHMDISGKWPADSLEYCYVLVIVEVCTRYAIFIPLKQKTAALVTEALLSRYISYFGIPNKIHSDLGKEFKNQIFDKLCNSLEINHTFTPVDVHNSNLSERSIRDLVKFFRILSDNEKATWSRFIPLFQIAQNSHFNTTLQTSPFQALTGRSISLPISLATQQPVDTKSFPLQEIFQRLLNPISHGGGP